MCELVFQKEQRVVRVALIRYLACTVPLSRLTHLASNSSVTVKMCCRGSTLNHQYNQRLRYHARSVGSRTTESVRATRGSTTQDGTDAIHGCCVLCCYLSHGSTQNGYPGRAVITSLVSMRPVCACDVPWCAVCCAFFIPQNTPSQPTRCMSQTLQATCQAPTQRET